MATKILTKNEYSARMKLSLLRRFKESMRVQFAERIRTHGGLTDVELRNVARTFALGWLEALAAKGDSIESHCWALAFGEITMDTWWPGPEWRFWE